MNVLRLLAAVSGLPGSVAVFPAAALAAAQSAAETAVPVAGAAAPATAHNAAAAATGAIPHTGTLFSWGGYFQALAILFLLVALLWLVLWYLKNKGGLRLLTRQGDLQLESRLSLGQKKSLVVVRFLNKRMLLGVTDHQITMLTELPADDDTGDTPDLSPVDGGDFTAHLRRAADHDTP